MNLVTKTLKVLIWKEFGSLKINHRDSILRVYKSENLKSYPPPRSNPEIKLQFVDNKRKTRKSSGYFMLPDYLKSPRRQSEITRLSTEASLIESCEITLATHLSVTNLQNLESMAMNWPGPISAAIYLDDPEQLENIENDLWNFFLKFEVIRRARVTFHLLLGHRFSTYNGGVYHPYDLLYPVNSLRNLALSRADGKSFVLTIDSAYIPSSEMYSRLCGDLKDLHQASLDNPTLFIIPEFEYTTWSSKLDITKGHPKSLTYGEEIQKSLNMQEFYRHCAEGWIIPDSATYSKQVLVKNRPLVSSSDYDLWCRGKLERPDWLNIPNSKAAIDYPRWFQSREKYKITMNSAVSKTFEPLFFARKTQHPVFNEDFKGGPFSKRPQIMDSFAAGYSLVVLPEIFVLKRTIASYLDHPHLKFEIIRDVLGATIGNAQAISRISNSRPKKFHRLLNSISWSEGFY